jgi:hypothetical protein
LPFVRDQRGAAAERSYSARRGLSPSNWDVADAAAAFKCATVMVEVWHLWTVFIPRRSITGESVLGLVWRRHNGRRWIYKEFVEFKGSEQ